MTVPSLPTNARALDEDGLLVRGAGPRSVTLYREMAFGGQLVHSLDYVVLTHVLFAIAANEKITVPGIWKRLQSLGIRSAKDHRELIGKNTVYESFNRIIAAGFIRRDRLPHPDGGGRKGAVVYQVFEFVTDNPDHVDASAAPLPGTGEVVDSNYVAAGQTTSRHPGSGVPGSGVPGSGSSAVPAGQTASPVPGSGDCVPPTPPYREEEDSSSRMSSSTTAVTAAAQATDAAALTAAAEFLAELPGRWACGRKTTAELAPLLAEVVQVQGWELGSDLAQQLTRRFQARRSVVAVLRERIEDLPRYLAVRKVLERERSTGGRVPGQQLVLEEGKPGGGAAPVLPEGVSPERVEEARAFLLTLSGPWALGPESAVRLAPLLASKTAERGWEFDSRLLAQLMSNPNGVNNYELILETHRIGRLPVRSSSVGEQRRGQDARQKAIASCATCDDYGQFEVGDAAVMCKHDEASATAALRPPAQREPAGALPASSGEPQAQEELSGCSLAEMLASMRQPAV
ncbi:hypothetical protein OG379_41235 (plasmid) [Streptomyces sp. NBC_01166]|uniref:hypothetical protein n=1 Tax=Streptomyces sp. NBC_01166 TaxID=2903755 RepID=UPI002F90D975|nr:hypothetical protein OG379_41235 [Streptomyces sp. NBC_01166]